MPIRFRCVYCDKLLGIARRKAGAVVNCPHCEEKLIVPTPDPADDISPIEDDEPTGRDENHAPVGTNGAQLFERSDFDALLNPQPTFRTVDPPPAAPFPKPVRPMVDSPPPPFLKPFPAAQNLPQPASSPVVSSVPPQPGFYISSGRATWLSVLAVVLLAAAFGAGLMVGRMMKG